MTTENKAGQDTQTRRGPDGCEDPRAIAKWARVYAQNRTLPFLVFMVVFLLLCGAIGGGSFLAGWAYMSGNRWLLATSMVWLVLALAANIYISIPRWGGKRMEQIAKRLYAREGNVAMVGCQTPRRRRLAMIAGILFGASIIASLILGMLGYIPQEYMQPVSALYIVPFLVVLGVLMRPASGWPMLLWPVLYTLHAILIVAGAPILFTGHWTGLNMLVPIAGYGLLSGLIGHLYSRFALRKVKRLAQVELPIVDEQGEATHP